MKGELVTAPIVNFNLNEDVKKSMEPICKESVPSTGAAFYGSAKEAGKEKRIPSEVVADPFYSEENMSRLRKAIQDLDAGKGTVHEVE